MRSAGDGERVRTFTEEARRRQIVECAIDVLAELGYVQASLAQIAKRAKISKGVISYHFEGKGELLEQAVVHVYTVGAEYVVPRILAASDARGGLRAYIESNIEFLDQHRKYAVAVGEIVLNLRDENGRLKYGRQTDGPIVRPLVEMLEEGQRTGEFGEFSALVMARVIRHAIDGAAGDLAHEAHLDGATLGKELADLFDRATRPAGGG